MKRTLLIPLAGILGILIASAFVLWYWSIERESDLETLRAAAGLFVAITLLIAAFSGWILYRAVQLLFIRPVRELRKVAEQAGRGELHHTAVVYRDDDVGELSRSINRMIENLRQAREDAVAESERRFRELVESSNAIPWEFDPREGRFTYVGPQAETLLGYPQASWTERGFWSEHVHAEDRGLAEHFLGRAVLGKETEIEYRMTTMEGGEVWIRDIVTFVPDGAGRDVLRGVRFDVTDRRRLQEQLFRSQRLEAVGQLAGGIAHDFNNLLTVVAGNAAAARSQLPEDSVAAEEIAEIEWAAGRATALTHQLLAYARKQVVSPTVLDLNAVLSDLARMLGRLAGAEVDVETRIADGLWPVRADLGQLEQVITNLVVNARDASPPGGTIQIRTRNETVSERGARRYQMPRGQYVVLSVLDTGRGMDAATRDRAFEPFFSTKGVGEGTGLGLATCYGIVKQAKGFIWVESEPEKGSLFEVFLPRVVSDSAADALPPSTDPVGDDRSNRGDETILLVDDEESVRRLTARALTRFGYRVLSFSNGHDAVAAAREATEPIHLLVTDIMMPEMGGREVADRVRKLLPGIRVLYTSGYSPDRFFAPRDLGRDQAFLQKPFVPASITAAIRELMDRDAD